eukprot:CAMPEP_0118926810 /NCGR_PEP_ID=MMETSP1169-20130426/4427_1 /TAXON_ID=36882 /ORGANISM="Pyramimonas obovata, Strain CCMP722" /LENGTH=270 /DNA_ID=CAMNT_0006868443 /DNA_START=150 /DNA_END=962 /DNA_ORIENTATION=-
MGAGASLFGQGSKDEKDKDKRQRKGDKKDKKDKKGKKDKKDKKGEKEKSVTKVPERPKRRADPVRIERIDKTQRAAADSQRGEGGNPNSRTISGRGLGNNINTLDVGPDDGPNELSDAEKEYWTSRFDSARTDNSDSVPISQLALISEFAGNPLIYRLLNVFDSNKDGSLSLEDFHEAVFSISRAQRREFKAVIAFRMYDVDEDNLVNKDDMMVILQEIVGEEVPRDVLETTVTQTIQAYDGDKDGALTIDEFKRLVDAGDVDVLFGYVP